MAKLAPETSRFAHQERRRNGLAASKNHCDRDAAAHLDGGFRVSADQVVAASNEHKRVFRRHGDLVERCRSITDEVPPDSLKVRRLQAGDYQPLINAGVLLPFLIVRKPLTVSVEVRMDQASVTERPSGVAAIVWLLPTSMSTVRPVLASDRCFIVQIETTAEAAAPDNAALRLRPPEHASHSPVNLQFDQDRPSAALPQPGRYTGHATRFPRHPVVRAVEPD